MSTLDDLSRQLSSVSAEMRVGFERLAGGHKVLEERLDGIKDAQKRTDRDVERLEAEMRKKLDTFDGELSDSKVHLLDEIKQERDDAKKKADELEKRRVDSGIWWKRGAISLTIKIIGGIIGFLLASTGMGYLLHATILKGP